MSASSHHTLAKLVLAAWFSPPPRPPAPTSLRPPPADTGMGRTSASTTAQQLRATASSGPVNGAPIPGSVRDFRRQRGRPGLLRAERRHGERAKAEASSTAKPSGCSVIRNVMVRRSKATATSAAPGNTTWLLGGRRADGVKRYLVSRGVSPARITTISYGKERPTDTGTGEDAYAHNRNAHTAITEAARLVAILAATSLACLAVRNSFSGTAEAEEVGFAFGLSSAAGETLEALHDRTPPAPRDRRRSRDCQDPPSAQDLADSSRRLDQLEKQVRELQGHRLPRP